MSTNGGVSLYVQTRKTIPNLSKVQKKALLLPDATMTIQSLKAILKKNFPSVLDSISDVDTINVYYYNHRADDYIMLKENAKVSTNPLPDLFTDPPGTTEDHPLFFDFEQETPTSTSSGEKIWVQPRKTIDLPSQPTAIIVPTSNIIANSFKASVRSHFAPRLDLIPSSNINLYYYNSLADDYIPITDAHSLNENPLPQLFVDPPGKTIKHPIFFDYMEMAGPGSINVWLQPRKTIGLPTTPVSLIVPTAMIINSFKAAIRAKFAPALDQIPAEDIHVYYFNHSADDYIPFSDGHPIAQNPLPELFTDAPGKTQAHPLFFDFIKRDSTAWVQPRKTIQISADKKEIAIPVSNCALAQLKAAIHKSYGAALGTVPATDLNIYFYNHSADDYIPLPPSFCLGNNPLPELFTDAPGTVFNRPLFFDYLKKW